MQETHGQYWGTEMYGLNAKIIFTDLSYCREIQSFVISLIADMRN